MSLLLLALAHAAPPPPPIVNGETTRLYPQVVMLRHADAGFNTVFVCSGTLIAPTWVLTAAHCTVDPYGYGLTEMRVFVGHEWTADAEEIVAAEWFPHPDYYVSNDGGQIDNDIGLVRLPEPLDLEPIPINEDAYDIDDIGEVLRWVGWGATGDYAYDSGFFKRYADIPVVGLEDEFILGYDAGGAATCGGDSGGAVLRLGEGDAIELVAAHSFGRDDDGTLCDGSTSGDTRVDLYVDWIRDYIGTEGEDTGPVGDDTGPAADDTGAADDAEAAGCGCVGAGGSTGGGLLVMLGVLGAARRRNHRA